MLQLIAFEYLSFTDENATAFMLSFWASMGTFLGGLIVVFVVGLLGADPKSKQTSKLMGILQALAAGVMIHMTCFHLIPESNAAIGARETMVYFFVGVVLFGLLETVIIPHGADDSHNHTLDNIEKVQEKSPSLKRGTSTRGKKKKVEIKHEHGGIKNISSSDADDLYRTSLITFIAMALHNIPEGISVYLTALSNPKLVNIY